MHIRCRRCTAPVSFICSCCFSAAASLSFVLLCSACCDVGESQHLVRVGQSLTELSASRSAFFLGVSCASAHCLQLSHASVRGLYARRALVQTGKDLSVPSAEHLAGSKCSALSSCVYPMIYTWGTHGVLLYLQQQGQFQLVLKIPASVQVALVEAL